MTIDTAIKRLQQIARSSTSVTVQDAPNYPTDALGVMPFVVTYLYSGESQDNDASFLTLRSTVNVDFHFNRSVVSDAYEKANALAPEFSQRLAGDPTLDGAVSSIIFPVSFTLLPAQWDSVTTQMLRFTVELKTLESLLTTST